MSETRKFHGTRVEYLSVLSLDVDPSFQRGKKDAHVARIVKEFDELLVKPFHVSRRKNGKQVILDGQQEWYAVQHPSINWPTCRCIVYEGLTVPQESKIYVGLNSSMPVSVKEKFKALLRAKDPDALKIQSICMLNGFKVRVDESGRPTDGLTTIKSPGFLQRIYNGYTPYILESTLHVVKEAFSINGVPDCYAIKDQFMQGIANFLHEKELTSDDAIDMLQGKNAEAIYQTASHNNNYSRYGLDLQISKLLATHTRSFRQAA